MACTCQVILSERWRHRLGTTLLWLNVFQMKFGLFCLIVGLYFLIRIRQFLDILEAYQSDSFPIMLITTGALMILLHGVGAKIWLDIGNFRKRERWIGILCCWMFVFFSLIVCTLAAAILARLQKSRLQTALHSGILSRLTLYRSSKRLKIEIDNMQIAYSCCGSDSYEDWLKIAWINTDYVDLTKEENQKYLVDGEYIKDDVPFSCCDPRGSVPCLNRNVNRLGDPGKSLHKTGCAKALLLFISEGLIYWTEITLFVAFGFELLMFILCRFLHTSAHNSLLLGYPEMSTPGYLCMGSGEQDMIYGGSKYGRIGKQKRGVAGQLARKLRKGKKKSKEKGKKREKGKKARKPAKGMKMKRPKKRKGFGKRKK